MRALGKKLVRTVRGHKVVVQAWRENEDDGFLMADFSIGQAFAGSDDDDLSASGTVRWDGCINWSDGGGTANHFCDPSALDAWALAMRAVWDMAAEAIDMEPQPRAPKPKGDTKPPRLVLCPDCAGAPLESSEPFSQASAAVCPTCCGEGKVSKEVANAFEQGRASFGHARTAGDDVDVTVRVRRVNLPSLLDGVVLGLDAYGRKPIRLRLKPVMDEADTFTIEVETNAMVALEAVPDPTNVEPVEDAPVGANRVRSGET